MKNLCFNECHFFEKEGNGFLFVVRSLQLYSLDRETYETVKSMYGQHPAGTVFERRKTTLIGDLLDAGILCTSEQWEEEQRQIAQAVERSETRSQEKKTVAISNIVLQVANDCNLNCKYCYGSGGSYGRKRELMSFDVARKGIDYMVENRGERTRLRITFFGGEPLLNFELIKKCIAYCEMLEKEHGITFGYSMTTNGTIVSDEILAYIKKYRFSLLVSMDGGKETQDCYRCFVEGKGSFDIIQPNLAAFKEANGGRLSVRATVCKPKMDMVAIRKELTELGFDNVIMSMVDTDSGSSLFLGNDTEEMILQYDRLAKALICDAKAGKPINNTFFNEILRKLYYKALSVKGCNAGSTGFAIGSDGAFYPCHRYMGMEDYICGNVDDGIDVEKTKIFDHVSVFEKADCKECWARFLCGGGCSNICVTQTGDVMKAPECYCDIYRGIYKIMLHMYYELKQWDDQYFRNLLDKDKDIVATVK